ERFFHAAVECLLAGRLLRWLGGFRRRPAVVVGRGKRELLRRVLVRARRRRAGGLRRSHGVSLVRGTRRRTGLLPWTKAAVPPWSTDRHGRRSEGAAPARGTRPIPVRTPHPACRTRACACGLDPHEDRTPARCGVRRKRAQPRAWPV